MRRFGALHVTHVTKAMLHEAQFHIAEGKFDALVKRFLGLLAKHGGSLDRRNLIKNLHIDHMTFRRIVMTLHMRDAIIEDSECGKNVVSCLKLTNNWWQAVAKVSHFCHISVTEKMRRRCDSFVTEM